jgi:hypothetical protein
LPEVIIVIIYSWSSCPYAFYFKILQQKQKTKNWLKYDWDVIMIFSKY